MFKLPSWFTQGVRRVSGGALGRLCLVVCGALLAVNANGQTQTTIQLTSSSYAVSETDGFVRIAIRRFGDLKKTSAVRVVTTDGTAVNGLQYVARSANFTFGTNVSELFFDVTVLDNTATNATTTFSVSLSGATNAVLGFPSFASVSITDDETGVIGLSSGAFEFSSATYLVTDNEGSVRDANLPSYQGAMVTVVRKNGARGRAMVDYAVTNGSAGPLGLYTPTSGTLVFDDYQMSAQFIVPIHLYTNFVRDFECNAICWVTNTNGSGFINLCTNGFFGTNLFTNFFFSCTNYWTNFIAYIDVTSTAQGIGNFLAFELNGIASVAPTFDAQLKLSNPRLDPAEDQNIPQPGLGSRNQSQLGIVIVDSQKDSDGNPIPNYLGMGLERAHYLATEAAGNYQMWVNRDFAVETPSFKYVVNTADYAPPAGNHEARTWRVEAGSDYASPFADYLPPGTVEWQRAMNIAPETITGPIDVTVQWGRTEFKPKPITVPIIQDDLVEFNEDLLVQLFQRTDDSGLLEPPAAPPFSDELAAPQNARLTILFDNIRYINNDNIFHISFNTNGVFGAEQPAGALDRRYNLYDYSDTDPPFNLTPGANGQVLALAVQDDGRLVIGGEFKAVNTQPSQYLARMTRDGQVDGTFHIGSGADGPVTAVDIQSDGKILIGGLFSSYQGTLRNGLARLNADGSLDSGFNPGLGAQGGPVRAMKALRDGRVLIGGEFTSFNGTNIAYFARLNSNGSLDTTFNTGSGPDDFVYAIDVYGKPVIIEQTSLEIGQRLERSDTYDVGVNSGTIILEYDFGNNSDDLRIYYNEQLLFEVPPSAALQGTATISFGTGPIKASQLRVVMNEGNPGIHDNIGTWQYRLTVLPNSDDRPVIGGAFTSYNGTPRGRIARVNNDGTLDTSFNPGLAIESGIVYSVAKHGSKVALGGAFSEFDRVSRNNIAQVHGNGAIDLTYDPGLGFNDIVFSVIVQPSGKVIAGGQFTEFNTSRRLGMARLNWDGKLDTGFMDTAYNQFAGLPNPYTWQPVNFINAMAPLRVTNTYSTSVTVTNQQDGSVTNLVFNFTRYEDQLFIGGSFENVGGGFLRDQISVRENFGRIWAGYTPGPGTISFSKDSYSADENSPAVFITVNRDNGDLAPVTGDFITSDLEQGPGVATESLDYFAATSAPNWPTARTIGNFSRRVSEAYRGNNNDEYQVTDQHIPAGGPGTNSVAGAIVSSIYVLPKDDNIQEGDEQLQLNLSVRPTTLTLGNMSIPLWPAIGRSTARLTIVDNDVSPGVIGFAQTQYFVDENGKKAQILLTRTNGAAGPVTVRFQTVSGGTATPGANAQTPNADYVQVPAKTVSFAAGQTNATVEIDILDDVNAEFDETVKLQLSSVSGSGGPILGLASAVLTIVDNDFSAGRLNFVTATNIVDEGASNVVITLKRAGGSSGAVQVEVSTSDITAINGLDYIGLTNFVVRWNSAETADKQVTIPILDRNVVDGARTFKVTLSNTRLSGVLEPNALGNIKDMIVQINDNDAFGNLRFSQPAYTVDENGTNAVITVVRVNGTTGKLTVGYEAVGDLAIPGQDFKPLENTNYLTFVDGQTSASFVVPIIDDSVVDGNKTVTVRLLGQTNDAGGLNLVGALGVPSVATLAIIDNELENIPAGSLDATFVAEGTDDFIHTVVQQSDGRLLIGGDFTAVNAVLRNRLARLNTDGSIDPSFFAGDGPNGTVRAMAVQEDGRILIAGTFTAVGATNRNYVARLVHDGGMDQTFDPGAGANNPIYALLIQSDGKIVIGGDFSAYGPTPRNGVARVNLDGKLDSSFNPGSGGSGAHGLTVYALAQQLDGKLLVGGDFETFNNVSANGLVRLNRDGTVDQSFDTSIGANGSVRALEVQPDGKILVGGLFTHLQGSAKFGFTNALTFGATNLAGASGGNTNLVSVAGDPIFDAGVISLNYDFTNLHNLLIQVGSQTLLSTNVQRPGVVTVSYPSTTSSGSAVRVVVNDGPQPGGKWSYNGSISGKGASRTNSFPIPAEVGFDSGLVTVDYNFTNKHSVRVVLDSAAGSTNIAYISNLVSSGTLEAKYFATNRSGIRVIVEDQAGMEISTNAGAFYSISGTLSRGAAGIARLNPDGSVDTTFNVASIPDLSRRGANGPVNAIKVETDGKIVVGGDFSTFNGVTRRGVTRLTADGLNDPTINFGTGTLGSVATVLIQPDRKIVIAGGFTEYNGVQRNRIARINGGSIVGSGRFEFAQAFYVASETQTNSLVITVRRTGGTSGSVAMNFTTQDDPTVPALQRAIGGLSVTNLLDDVDYQITAGTLVFPESETLKTFTVPLKDDTFVEGNEYFQVALSDLPGEPFRLGDQPTAQVMITSDDSEIYFSSAAYSVGESTPSGVANITISRAGSVSSSVSVVLATRDITATNGLDYVGSTNTITFAPGETNRVIAIPIISDTLVEGNEFVGLTLLSPSAGGQLRPNGNTATLLIVDDDFSPGEIAFADTSYSVIEGEGAVGRVRVVRRNGTFGTATVRYTTTAITATPGSDYIDQTGVLTFEGETEKFIEIPIVNDDISEPNKTVGIRLSNVTGGATLGVDTATLTIVDDDLSSGSLDSGFNPGIAANGIVRTLALAPGRRFLIGGDFTAYNGDTNQSRLTRLVEAGSVDTTFIQTTNRPNNSVASFALQPDNKLIIGGSFFAVGSAQDRRVARLLPNQMVVDPTFWLPIGLDGQVSTIALQTDGKVIVGGDFTAASASERGHIARLMPNGTVDISFNPAGGADNTVNVATLQSNGKVLIGGAFSTIAKIGAGRIARLNADGSLDSSFRTGVGFTRSDSRPPMVYDIVLLSSGKILVAGDFTSYNNTNCGGIALLDQNGLLQTYTWLDATNGLHTNAFGSELQLNGAIRTVAVERTDRNSDDKLIIGGDFTSVNDLRQPVTSYARGRIARLDPATGRIDPTFDPGDGANDSVFKVVVQPWNGKVLVAGAFTQFNNNTNLHGIARLNNDKAFVPPTGSTPVTISNSVVVAGQLSITFIGENNVDYVIQGTTELATNPANTVWTDVKDVVGSGSASITQIPITGNYRFFRIVAQ